MAIFDVSLKSKHINSKALGQSVESMMDDVAQEYVSVRDSRAYGKAYDYTQVVTLMDMFMESLRDQKQVNYYYVIGDHRNNLDSDMSQGKFNIVIRFQQYNCLNITEMSFTLIARA